MKFFFDNNLSVHLAHGLKEFGEDVIHLTDKFLPDTPDEKWLMFVGDNGFSLVTKDRKIRFRPVELDALKKYRVGAFFLGGKNLDHWGIIQQVVRNWPRMKEYATKERPPFAFIVPPSGTEFRRIALP
jgi:hypothetical protein